MSEFVLDGPRIYRLCGEQNVSLIELGACLGASGQRATRLLAGAGAHVLTLRELSRLGERLGVDPLSLFVAKREQQQTSAEEAADAVKIHAVLARQPRSVSRQELARVLDWDLRRTNAALGALQQLLARTGEMLHQPTPSSFQVRARDEVLTEDERQRADRAHLHRTGLNTRSARRLLYLVESGETIPRDNRMLLELGEVVNQGLAHRQANGKVKVNADVVFSLGLDTEASTVAASSRT